MKFKLPWLLLSLLLLGWLSTESAAQELSPPAAPPQPKPAVSNGTDYARTLRDPFSPIGHPTPQEASLQPITPGPIQPSGSLIGRALARLQGDLKAVVQRGTNYVAYVGGTIVQVGDELSATVDGVTVTFIIRAIGPGNKIELEPQK